MDLERREKPDLARPLTDVDDEQALQAGETTNLTVLAFRQVFSSLLDLVLGMFSSPLPLILLFQPEKRSSDPRLAVLPLVGRRKTDEFYNSTVDLIAQVYPTTISSGEFAAYLGLGESDVQPGPSFSILSLPPSLRVVSWCSMCPIRRETPDEGDLPRSLSFCIRVPIR